MTTRFALIALLAACHSKAGSSATPANTATAPAAAAPLDCGTVDSRTDITPDNAPSAYQCFADAFGANREATVTWLAVTDEGGKIITTYRSIPGVGGTVLAITTDDRDDGFSGSPGIHELICTSLRIEPTSSNSVVLHPEGCSGSL